MLNGSERIKFSDVLIVIFPRVTTRHIATQQFMINSIGIVFSILEIRSLLTVGGAGNVADLFRPGFQWFHS